MDHLSLYSKHKKTVRHSDKFIKQIENQVHFYGKQCDSVPHSNERYECRGKMFMRNPDCECYYCYSIRGFIANQQLTWGPARRSLPYRRKCTKLTFHYSARQLLLLVLTHVCMSLVTLLIRRQGQLLGYKRIALFTLLL